MKTNELLSEASYPGNIGMMEMFQFFKKATPSQKSEMESLLSAKKFQKAWEFLQQVVKIKLQ